MTHINLPHSLLLTVDRFVGATGSVISGAKDTFTHSSMIQLMLAEASNLAAKGSGTAVSSGSASSSLNASSLNLTSLSQVCLAPT